MAAGEIGTIKTKSESEIILNKGKEVKQYMAKEVNLADVQICQWSRSGRQQTAFSSSWKRMLVAIEHSRCSDILIPVRKG